VDKQSRHGPRSSVLRPTQPPTALGHQPARPRRDGPRTAHSGANHDRDSAKHARRMKDDRVEVVVAADDGSRTHEIVATRAEAVKRARELGLPAPTLEDDDCSSRWAARCPTVRPGTRPTSSGSGPAAPTSLQSAQRETVGICADRRLWTSKRVRTRTIAPRSHCGRAARSPRVMLLTRLRWQAVLQLKRRSDRADGGGLIVRDGAWDASLLVVRKRSR
jgi:hypothetical protein